MVNKEILLGELKKSLNSHLSNIVEKVILFGSQIKGNSTDSSDFDIIVLLKEKYDWYVEEKIIDISYEISLKYNIIMDIKVFSKLELNTLRGKQSFVLNALEYGVAV